MLIRTYRAKNLKDALTQVKSDLGEHATILSTRSIRNGLLSSVLEVTAALSAPGMSNYSSVGKKKEPSVRATPPAPTPRPAVVQQEQSGVNARQLNRFLTPMHRELKTLRSELRELSQTDDLKGMQSEVADLRDRLKELTSLVKILQEKGIELTNTQRLDQGIDHNAQRNSTEAAQPALLDSLVTKLERSGMAPAGIKTVIEIVKEKLPSDPMEATACADALAVQVIQSSFICGNPLDLSHETPLALIGPPGVGKTTTLAKIVTRAALIHDRNVALIGCDTTRIGATQGLRSMGETLGVPCRIVSDENQLAAAIVEFDEHDLVAIDTPGYAPRDRAALTKLSEMLRRVGARPHLVLNADMRSMELECVLNAYLPLDPKSLCFTRLDQAVGLGGVYDVAAMTGLPIGHLCTGKRIPDDIEGARPEQLASLIMGLQYN